MQEIVSAAQRQGEAVFGRGLLKQGVPQGGVLVTKERVLKRSFVVFVVLGILLVAGSVLAHVPYIEHSDYTALRPFVVKDSIENSKAVYAWFETGTDVDVYTFEVTGPSRVVVQALVPVCPTYAQLLPWFAVVGPGLPEPAEDVPFRIPNGYGAIVGENVAPGAPRTTF